MRQEVGTEAEPVGTTVTTTVSTEGSASLPAANGAGKSTAPICPLTKPTPEVCCTATKFDSASNGATESPLSEPATAPTVAPELDGFLSPIVTLAAEGSFTTLMTLDPTDVGETDKGAFPCILSEESTFEMPSAQSCSALSHPSNASEGNKFVSTRHGALSQRVFPESQENKDKKYTAIAPDVTQHAPMSSAIACPISEADVTQPNVKVLHFVRHGEGTSNSAARLHGKQQYKSAEWTDARLTRLGKEQAKDINAFVTMQGIEVDLVMVSPLRRATETGCIVWAGQKAPFVACELLRERAHGNPCDFRSTKAELAQDFDVVDFSGIAEADPLQEAHARLGGESWHDTARRAAEFLEYVKGLEARSIAVVTHSAFLLTMFSMVFAAQEGATAGSKGMFFVYHGSPMGHNVNMGNF